MYKQLGQNMNENTGRKDSVKIKQQVNKINNWPGLKVGIGISSHSLFRSFFCADSSWSGWKACKLEKRKKRG